MILAPDTPTNLNTIIDGFALVVSLFVLKEFSALRDWRLKNDGLPASVERLKTEVLRLSDMVEGFVRRFDAHCTAEEQWQKNASDEAALSAKMTKAAIEECEKRLGEQIDKFHERRKSK